MKRFVLCAAVLLSLSSISSRAQKSPEEKLNMTMYAIMNMYVDTVDKTSFVDGMIARAMNELDPFSAYLTPEEVMASEAALLGPTAGDPSTFPVNTANAGESSGIYDGYASGTVQTAYIADKKSGTGYIRLTMFAEHTLDEFKSAVSELRKQGMKNLVLDLQGNPGGFFESAVAVADEFLDGDKTIVTTSGAHIPTRTASAQIDGCFEKGRLVLLVDDRTMSAAEILAGALRDWDRAVLVGRPTFGKGLIQETLPFEDGSALRITVARYLTPSGMQIQKPYEGYGRVYADPTLVYRSLLKGRELHSGGGIGVDVQVPRDTTFMTEWYYNLAFNGMQKMEAASYLERNRDALLKKYRTSDIFFRKFNGEEEMFSEMVGMAEGAGITCPGQEYERTAPAVKTQLKALLARALYPDDHNIYYRILNTASPSVIRALEIIRSDEYDNILK